MPETVKNIGKPCAGKPHARFDEGGLAETVKVRLVRHRQTKGTETDRQRAYNRPSQLSTLPLSRFGEPLLVDPDARGVWRGGVKAPC